MSETIEVTSLAALGWTETLAAAREGDEPVARVVSLIRGHARVHDGARERAAVPAGRLRGDVVVGDFVALEDDAQDPARIARVFERRSLLRRKAAGETSREQAVAANVDRVGVVEPLDRAPNLRRIERGVTLAWSAGAVPFVVLTKADACDDVAAVREQVDEVAPFVDVVALSSVSGEGVADLAALLTPASTTVLIGPSGVGKSTLVNALFGHDVQAVAPVRAGDKKGRHTTTARELFALPSGALIIDTPGTRELGLAGDEDDVEAAFADIAALAVDCRFRDCAHEEEPGCAVAAAVERGALDAARLDSYHRQRRELRHLEERQRAFDPERKARERRFGRMVKEAQAHNKRRR